MPTRMGLLRRGTETIGAIKEGNTMNASCLFKYSLYCLLFLPYSLFSNQVLAYENKFIFSEIVARFTSHYINWPEYAGESRNIDLLIIQDDLQRLLKEIEVLRVEKCCPFVPPDGLTRQSNNRTVFLPDYVSRRYKLYLNKYVTEEFASFALKRLKESGFVDLAYFNANDITRNDDINDPDDPEYELSHWYFDIVMA